jgi:uncharacterized membrane protein
MNRLQTTIDIKQHSGFTMIITGLRILDWGLIIAIILPLIAISPIFGNGIIQTSDSALHAHRIEAMTIMLRSGALIPRWVPYLHAGYGYPLFNFYAPGVYYVGGLLKLIGFATPTAYFLVIAFGWMLGSAGVYKLAHQFMSIFASILAAKAKISV